jgi:SAM-dependent methyltransferase
MNAAPSESMTLHDLSASGEAWGNFYRADTVTWFRPEYATCAYMDRFAQSEWIQRLLFHARVKPNSGACVLEAGCGVGMYSLALARLGFDVQAFDYNAEAVARAEHLQTEVLRECAFQPARFFRDNLLQIRQPDDAFDLVFNQAVLEYFTDVTERTRALQEMARVTKPGGCVVVIVQHTAHRMRAHWERMGWEGYTRQPPVCAFTPAALERELRAAGLQDVRVDGIEPWKVLFFYPRWHERSRVAHQAVYLFGRAARFIPLPHRVRAAMALQILGVGWKI